MVGFWYHLGRLGLCNQCPLHAGVLYAAAKGKLCRGDVLAPSQIESVVVVYELTGTQDRFGHALPGWSP